MSEQDYSQFLFEKHDQNKFNRYEELNNAFKLPNDKNKTLYLFDELGGWCDLNGCYYNSQGQPNGWIILSKDGKKYMRFNMNTEFIEDKPNIYYSNKVFDATTLEQNQQRINNKNDQEQQQQQQSQNQKQKSKQENKKQYNQSNQTNHDGQRKQKYNKQNDQEGERAKPQVISEKVKDQEEEDKYIEKIDQQLPKEINNTNDDQKTNNYEVQQRKQRDKKQYDRKSKNQKKDDQNQDKNESKKYYILNINDNSLSKEEFLKYLIEECKIKEQSIIEYNENILKLAHDKDAIKLYRLNKKQQTDKVQKFIVST